MTAFWIARATVRDRDAMAEYSRILRGVKSEHSFVTLSRNQRFVHLEGDRSFEAHFLHQFPSVDAALAMYESSDYQRARQIREAACVECELVILEGGDGVPAE